VPAQHLKLAVVQGQGPPRRGNQVAWREAYSACPDLVVRRGDAAGRGCIACSEACTAAGRCSF
jgi:hypothetical protein